MRTFLLNSTVVLAGVSLFLFAGFRYNDATWLLGTEAILVACSFGLLFLVLVALTRRYLDDQSKIITISLVVIVSAMIGGATLAIVTINDLEVSRLMVMFETGVLFALLLLNQKNVNAALAAAANVLAFAIALYPSVVDGSLSELAHIRHVRTDDSVRYVLSSRHDSKVVDHAIFGETPVASGGGLARIDDQRILLVRGDGEIVVLTPLASDLEVLKTNLRFPLKYKQYSEGVETPTPFFRVTGVLLEAEGSSRRRLYVAHHDWNTEQKCVTLNLSETELDIEHLAPYLNWTTRFTTQPCVSGNKLSNESGGRLAFLNQDRILMTIGGHQTEEMVALNRNHESIYGTVIALHRSDWSARTFTTGHRNPQGLLIDNGQIWSTEHGPHGGDELNLLTEGTDYGWPRSTYGTEYGQKSWPLINGDDPHGNGVKPVFAWVPSIGVSNLIKVHGKAFPAWKDNLVVGSLAGLGNGYSIFRVVLDGERVVVVEKLNTRRPVRDLIEHSDGRIVLWDGARTVQIVEPAAHVFAACSGCHALRWRSHGIGPDLMGIVGAKVAAHQDFHYSGALQALRGRWTRDRLDKFLDNPAQFAPGTTMDFPGIEDAEQRAAIIEYLDELDDNR